MSAVTMGRHLLEDVTDDNMRKAFGEDAVLLRIRFPNGLGASVIKHRYSYGGPSGLWELGIIWFTGGEHDDSWEFYRVDGSDEVEGWLSEDKVTAMLDEIESWPKPVRGQWHHRSRTWED